VNTDERLYINVQIGNQTGTLHIQLREMDLYIMCGMKCYNQMQLKEIGCHTNQLQVDL